MNVRLKKNFSWCSGLVYNDQFMVNQFGTELTMITVSDDLAQQNIAYERMKFWFHDVMEGAVLMAQNDKKLEQWHNMGARIMTLPDAPVDQLVGIMLCSKLNAIMEDRIVVTDVELWSRAGDSMSYLHNWKENPGPLGESGWWTDARPIWNLSRAANQDKVVSLDLGNDWKQHELDWDTEPRDTNDTVVFAKFNRDADQ